MGTVSDINTLVRPAVPVEVQESYWTDVKIKQVWLYASSALSLVGAAAAGSVALASAPLWGVAAFPLVGLSAGLAWYARGLIDYDDPVVLNRLRGEIAGMPLPAIIKKHGWDKFFGYALLDAPSFERAYAAHVDTLSFADLLRYYHATESKLSQAPRRNRFASVQGYSIPTPFAWKEKFESESKDLRCDAIFKRYPFADLKAFALVSADQLQTLEKTGKAIREKDARHNLLEQQFRDRTPYEHAAQRSAVDLAELNYRSHPGHAMLRQIDVDERFQISELESYTCARIRSERCALESFRSSLLQRGGGGLSECAQQELCCRQAQTERAISCLRAEERDGILRIRAASACRRAPIEETLNFARDVKKRSIAAANEEFRLRTLSVRREIDALHAENRNEYEKKIAELDLVYRGQ